jgi:predicted enzyme related to lactoylglutathione lyase
MAPSFIGMRTIIYHVADLPAATKWYTLATGINPYFEQPYYVGFTIGGIELGLDPSPDSGKPGPGGTTAYWGVANVEDAVSHLISAGATLGSPARDVGDGILVATVIDPFGNELGVIENPYFKLEDVR